MTSDSVGYDDSGLYRAGGFSALALGAGYLAIFPLYAQVGAPPAGGGAVWLRYLEGKTTIWWAILWLSVITDLLYVPVGLALFAALRGVNRSATLVATGFVLLFVVVDLAVTWSHIASLLTLRERYGAATTDAQRAACIAAAEYASAVLGSRLLVVYAIGILSFAILLIGVVMLKGPFSRTTAYLGLATGVLGIASFGGWGVTIILNAVGATIWLLFVGVGLRRLARS